MRARCDRPLRVVALVLVFTFGAGATHASAMSMRTCQECPADCPMHARHLSCHHGAASTPQHCHRDSHEGTGLRAAGCAHRATAALATDQQALLPTAVAGAALPLQIDSEPVVVLIPSNVALDPPFHPPAAPLHPLHS